MFGVAERCEHPVVDGEQVELGQPGEQPGVGAVAAADGELVQQARHADVAGGEASAAGPFDERAREEALADAARPGEDQIVALGDPPQVASVRTCCRLSRQVDGLEVGGMARLGGAEPAVELALLAGRPLGVDEEAEAFLEGEGGGLVGPELVPAGVGHGAELHGIELVEGSVRSAWVHPGGRSPVAGAAEVLVGAVDVGLVAAGARDRALELVGDPQGGRAPKYLTMRTWASTQSGNCWVAVASAW